MKFIIEMTEEEHGEYVAISETLDTLKRENAYLKRELELLSNSICNVVSSDTLEAIASFKYVEKIVIDEIILKQAIVKAYNQLI